MKKKILLALLVSQISIHASMNQSALTKKTTGTLGEFIAQHKTTIGFVAAASLAAYHYREPIVGYIKNIFSSDLETSGSADAALNQSSSLNTNTLDSEAGFLRRAAISGRAHRDLHERLPARRLRYKDDALEGKTEATAQNDQDSSSGLDRAINPDDVAQRALSTATFQILSIQAALDEHKSASSSSSQLLVVPPIQLPHHTSLDDEKYATKREKLETNRLHSYPGPEVSSLAAGASAQVEPEIEEVKAILDGIILTAGNLLGESELSLRDESDDNAQTTMNTLEAAADILSQPRLTAAQLVQDQEALLHTPTTALNTDTRGILLLTAAATSNSAEPASGYHTPQ